MNRQQHIKAEVVFGEVLAELRRQNEKWGEQNHALGTGPDQRFLGARFSTLAQDAKAECQANGPGEDTWAAILLEEVFEALEEADPARVRAELIQVAAVAVQAVLSIDRQAAATRGGE